eukprot:6202051-Pleurochrysis_carterae.AAC.1
MTRIQSRRRKNSMLIRRVCNWMYALVCARVSVAHARCFCTRHIRFSGSCLVSEQLGRSQRAPRRLVARGTPLAPRRRTSHSCGKTGRARPDRNGS